MAGYYEEYFRHSCLACARIFKSLYEILLTEERFCGDCKETGKKQVAQVFGD